MEIDTQETLILSPDESKIISSNLILTPHTHDTYLPQIPKAIPDFLTHENVWNEFRKGLYRCLPIVLGYLPVAFAYGVLAAHAGLNVWVTMALSVFVYAGASQFVAVGLLGAAASPVTIIVTTFIINARHFLMSTAMVRFLGHWPRTRRFLFCIQMTDETFALHASRLEIHEDSPTAIFSSNWSAHLSWIFGTFFGYYAHGLFPRPEIFGLDFALPAMFIAMTSIQLRTLLALSAALMAAGMVILMNVTPAKEWSIVIAAIAGAGIGALGETWETISKTDS